MHQYNISIIIPVYNVAEYITECLQSVMRQTYKGAIECILVDDCGTDDSITIAEQLIAEYNSAKNGDPIEKTKISFKILHHDHNRGLSAARNTGTDVATGDYIYYLDSDDYISDDCIEVLTEPLQKKEYDMVLGDIQPFGDNTNLQYLFVVENEINGNKSIFTYYANRQLYVMAWNKLCRRSFLKNNDITFLEGQLHEDELWTYKVMSRIDSIAIQHSYSYFYRSRGGSIANTNNLTNGMKAKSYFDTIQYIILHPYDNDELYSKVVDFYVTMYIGLALSSNMPFYSQYKYIRCHYLPQGKASQIGIQSHFKMPVLIGYCFAKLWYWCKQNLKFNK